MNSLANAKVLITGGAGFIGSHIVQELLKTDLRELIIYDNFARGDKSYLDESFKDKRCKLFLDGSDIRDIDQLDLAMQGCDYVFHTAAMWLLHCKDFPRTAFNVNIAGTFNILEACVKHKVKKLIYSSSASVYGDAIAVPMTEEHPFLNQNFYGATKIAGEAMCRAFFDRYGLDYIGLRYMNVYGPHQDQTAAYTGVIPIMLNKIDANEEPTINGDGSQAYDFIYVDDVAVGNVCALKSKSTNQFYNIGTGIQTSIKQLCDKILDLKKSKLRVNYKPYSNEDARQMVQNRIGSTKKASKEINFNFKVDLETGLNNLIKWRNLNK
jgi:UDP-glucose 4-epimerase